MARHAGAGARRGARGGRGRGVGQLHRVARGAGQPVPRVAAAHAVLSPRRCLFVCTLFGLVWLSGCAGSCAAECADGARRGAPPVATQPGATDALLVGLVVCSTGCHARRTHQPSTAACVAGVISAVSSRATHTRMSIKRSGAHGDRGLCESGGGSARQERAAGVRDAPAPWAPSASKRPFTHAVPLASVRRERTRRASKAVPGALLRSHVSQALHPAITGDCCRVRKAPVTPPRAWCVGGPRTALERHL